MPDEKNLATAPTQPAMPAQPRTVEVPAMTDRAMLEDLYRISKSAAIDTRNIRSDLDLLIGDVSSLKVDVRELQRWKIDAEDRATKNSQRAKEPSQHDLDTKAELSKEISAREALAARVEAHGAQLATIESKTDKQTLMLTTISSAVTGVRGFVKQNPGLVAGVVGLVSAICGWLSSYIQSRGH